MKRCLCEKVLLNNGDASKKIKIDEIMFLKSVKLIAEDISSKYSLEDRRIGLIGIARGAMPLLTAVSHYLKIRDVSIMQVQMTNSDDVKDYGTVHLINEMLDPQVEHYIVLEDIVSHGRCSNFAINRLLSKGKKVDAVYSIVMNEYFEEHEYDYSVDVNYVYLINDKQWVYFLWEKGYLDT